MPSLERKPLCIIGLGYVGLPLARAFTFAGFPVVGYDSDAAKVARLQADFQPRGLTLTSSEDDLDGADTFIICVPTPVDSAHRPDVTCLTSACHTVGRHLRRGGMVVIESSVAPGCTEKVCLPIVESESGLGCPADFDMAYSPERVNPGDGQHTVESVVKVVAAVGDDGLDRAARLYSTVAHAGVHRAPSIRVAEAAKMLENTQRDVNIALMNECAMLFDSMGVSTTDVLAAARTKWNFLPFTPGLVGGHCIGVDPYYLMDAAQSAGQSAPLIRTAREVNNAVAPFVARKLMSKNPRRVLILGVAYKPNVPDVRNSQSIALAEILTSQGLTVDAIDPVADARLCPMPLKNRPDGTYDAIVCAVRHDAFAATVRNAIKSNLADGGKVYDLAGFFTPAEANDMNIWKL